MNATEKQARAIKKLAKPSEEPGILAFMGDGNGNVDAGDGYVYARLIDNGEVVTVYNQGVQHREDALILLGYRRSHPNLLQALSSWGADAANPSVPDIGQHHETHELNGGDDVWLAGDRFLPLLITPSSGFVAQIYGSGNVTNQQLDLSSYVPAAGAKYVLIQADEAGTVTVKEGATVGSKGALTNADIPTVDLGNARLWAVQLYDGQEQLNKDTTPGGLNDFKDLRFTNIVFDGLPGEDLAYTIHAADASAITDDDEMGFWESVADDLKKITWANVKSTLKTYFDSFYPHKFYKSTGPLASDDSSDGYAKGDIWIDQVAGLSYICIDDTDDAAVWLQLGSGGSAGGGSLTFAVDGVLAVAGNVPNAYVFTADATIEEWYVYLKETGTAGSSIFDINLNGTTIFTTQANRPEVAYDDADGVVIATPDVTDFVAGDVLTFDIDQVATGAADVVCVGGAIGGGGTSTPYVLTVEELDGTPSVSDITKIVFDGATVTDDGSGQVTVTIDPPDETPITDLVKITFDAGTTTAGQSYTDTSSGSISTFSVMIAIDRPLKLSQVKWDVSTAKTYALKIYRGNQTATVFKDCGTQVAAGRTAELAFSADDVFMPVGLYLFVLSWTGACVVDRLGADCPIYSNFYRQLYVLYDTTFYVSYSNPIYLVAYLGTEEIME